MIPEFMRFYGGYTMSTTLNEYAQTFFSLLNSMYRLKASEAITAIHVETVPNLPKSDQEDALSELKKASKGTQGILDELRIIENVK